MLYLLVTLSTFVIMDFFLFFKILQDQVHTGESHCPVVNRDLRFRMWGLCATCANSEPLGSVECYGPHL